jgi:hypothetical protein
MRVTGVIGISSPLIGRYTPFYPILMAVDTPQDVMISHGISPVAVRNRNKVTAEALNLGAEWVWYVDDDQVFVPDTLTRLLARNVDVVSGLYLQRSLPFGPHMYGSENPDGSVCTSFLTEQSGMQDVAAIGAGCLLVRTNVLHALEPPYWRIGQIAPDTTSDDIHFCHRVREKGFKIWCDTDVTVGHYTVHTVWPRKYNGVWKTCLTDIEGRAIGTLSPAYAKEGAV